MTETRWYVYPDGFITDEAISFCSDDYVIIHAETEEEARFQAVQLGFI